MRAQETANGDYIVHDKPVLHWFVVIIMIVILLSAWFRDVHGAWYILPIIILISMLSRNTSFNMTTIFSLNDLKIRTEHRKLFGIKRHEVDFSAVQELEFANERWGARNQNPRASLTLCTIDEEMNGDSFAVFTMANSDKGKIAADRISEILNPYLAPEIPETAPIPPWFGNDAPSRLYDLCRMHSSETCFFVSLEDLDESRRTAMESKLSLPKDEKIVAFHDLTTGRSGERGIAVGCGGLYWRNGFSTYSKSTWISWERFVDAEVSVDPNDADVWIAPSMQLDLGSGEKARQKTVYELLLAIQGELRQMRDQHA